MTFLLVLFALWAPAQAWGQGAWTPPKGEFRFTPSYQFVEGGAHLLSQPFVTDVDHGKAVDFGTVQSQSLFLDGTIGITDKFAVNAAIILFGSRSLEDGLPEAVAYGELDDGAWHGGLQDGRI